MAGRQLFSDENKLYYVTLTCFEWLPIIKRTKSYDVVYEWFERLRSQMNVEVTSRCCVFYQRPKQAENKLPILSAI